MDPDQGASKESDGPRHQSKKKVIVPGYGEMTFRFATLGMYSDALEAADKLGDEREAAEEFVSSIIIATSEEPHLTREEILALSPDAIQAIAAGIGLGHEEWVDKVDPELPYAQRLYRAIRDRDKHLLDRIEQMVQRASEPFRELTTWAESYSGALNELGGGALADLVVSDTGIQKLVDSAIPRFEDMVAGVIPVMDKISALRLPEPLLSSILIAAEINIPDIHTPAYEYLPPPHFKTADDFRKAQKDFERHRLVDAYDVLVQLETALRSFIEERLRALYGDRWWKQGAPSDVRQSCEGRKQEKEKSSRRAHHPISYAYLDDLKKIIVRRDNWREVFEDSLGGESKELISASLVHCARIRPDIAHSRSLSDTDYLRFIGNAHWIIELIGVG